MTTEQAGVEKAPPIIERFMRQLVVANKAVALYPPSSTIPRENAVEAVNALNDALEEYPEISLAVTKNGLYFDDLPIFPGQSAFDALAMEFYNRRLAVVRFHSGVTPQDIISFLTVLKYTPEELIAAGGYEAQLWDQGVGTITVIETQVTLVNQQTDEGEGEYADDEGISPTTTSVEVRSSAPRSRERIELARVSGDEAAIRHYLTDTTGEGGTEGGTLDLAALRKRFVEFSHMISEQTGPPADKMTRMFADALWALDPEMRQQLLENELLPEARTSESVGGTLRKLNLEEIMRMLVDGEDFDERKMGFIRALKNLVQISHMERERVAQAATGAMQAAGASREMIDEVISQGVPTKLTVRRSRPRTGLDGAAALVLNLIDQAPLSGALEETNDPDILALREEAEVGVTDGDIIASLVTLAGLESRETQFANTMSSLEDALDALVARGDIETAAEAALNLVHAAENPSLSPEQVRRLEGAVTRFARPDDIRAITQTLRTYEPGQPEYEAAQRLLNTLGALAVRPLLEQLADEPDRAERKALVDLISKDADKNIPELALHVTDSRWYFVRNVVAILGSTKSPTIIGAMERTLRHPEPRVRRETIRALSMVQDDRMAIEMLVAALTDEDAHNVQLAARYLGLRGTRAAVPGLEAVAKGEGRGNRENGPRVEAMEALGRIGEPEALPTLQALARKRSIIGGRGAKELRTAAESAVAALKAKGGQR
ncbi:MAG: HEAT repeat domain-containing protein [Coriobacteriia bacterium]|nr:HEAT repeat domain-containing protein [Coriobacteriia bacterium]